MFAYTCAVSFDLIKMTSDHTFHYHCLILNFKDCFRLLGFVNSFQISTGALCIVLGSGFVICLLCYYPVRFELVVGTWALHTSALSPGPHLSYSMFCF